MNIATKVESVAAVSRLQEQLRNGKFVVTAELTPPVSGDARGFVERGFGLRDLVTAINITDGAGAKAHMSSLVAAHFLLDAGIEPILQLTCRDRNRIALQSDLLSAAASGVRNLLMLRGDDPSAGDQPDAMPVFDLDPRRLLETARLLRDKSELPSGRKVAGSAPFFLGAADNPIDPAPGWQPAGWAAPDAAHRAKRMISSEVVHIDQALKTPQFYQLWIVLCFNVTAGIGVLSVAKTMMTEIFGTTLPGIVDGSFAATYVVMISVFNMTGRFFWASISDFIGRRATYWIFFTLGIALYLSIPYCAHHVSVSPSVLWLIYFYAATMIIFTMYGGGFATIPAYLADIFGIRFVGGIHGRLLTAWSTAGVLGPLAITSLRKSASAAAIADLAAKVDPRAFEATFGAGLDQLQALVAQKTVTIAKLMEIAPAGTVDPTSSLYNTTMYLMAVLLGIALLCNAAMRPVDSRHHMRAG